MLRARRLPAALLGAASSLAALSLAACDPPAGDGRAADPQGTAAPTASATATAAAAPAQPDPNPFKLPPRTLTLAAGRRVFTVPERMLDGAKLGSTLILHAATVAGFDGELLVIEGKSGPPYKIHPAYAIAVPDDASTVRPGDPILTEHNGLMRHAVAKRRVKDRLAVRYLEDGARTAEISLKDARILRQADGLLPGNYAAFGDGESLRHVLLVSPFNDGEKRWLVLGAGGAALIAPEAALEPIGVKYQPRAGAAVLAEHNGALRRATIQSSSEPGLFTVKYERAGRPVTLGWGFLMPAGPERPRATSGNRSR